MLADKEKGYVDQFDDYVADLKQFHDEVIAQDKPAAVLLAHSMGAISARYLERWPNDIQAAVLSLPMMGINLGGLPKWLAKGVGGHHRHSRRLGGRAPPTAMGQGPMRITALPTTS